MNRKRIWSLVTVCMILIGGMTGPTLATLPPAEQEVDANLLVRQFPDLFLPPLQDVTRTGFSLATIGNAILDAGGATVATSLIRSEIIGAETFRPRAGINGDFAGLAVNADAGARLVSRWRFTHPTLPNGSVAPLTFSFDASGALLVNPSATSPATGFAGVDLTVGLFTDFAGPVPPEVVTQAFAQAGAGYQLLEDLATTDPDDYIVSENGFGGGVGLTDGGAGSFVPYLTTSEDVMDGPDKIGFRPGLSWEATFPGIVGAEYAIEYNLDSFASATDGGANVLSDFGSTGTFSIENEFGDPFELIEVPEPTTLALLGIGVLGLGRRRAAAA